MTVVPVAEDGPDLLVLDVSVPGMSGQDMWRRLRAAPATGALPIMTLTARGRQRALGGGFAAGADDPVTPSNPRELASRVQAPLVRHRR